jgi:hypothetical protein
MQVLALHVRLLASLDCKTNRECKPRGGKSRNNFGSYGQSMRRGHEFDASAALALASPSLPSLSILLGRHCNAHHLAFGDSSLPRHEISQ